LIHFKRSSRGKQVITGDGGERAESLNLQPSLQKERPQHGNDGEVEGLLEGAFQEDGGGAGDAGCSSHGAR